MNEQAPITQPDESKFNAMQIEAEAAGPEAEARRQKMNDWAEHQGAMAEDAASVHNDFEHKAKESGAENSTATLTQINKFIAGHGVDRIDNAGYYTARRPVKKGVLVQNGNIHFGKDRSIQRWETFRSPADMQPNSGRRSARGILGLLKK